MENHYQEKIIEMLKKANQPMDIEKIRVDVGIGNWNTALKHCLELLIAKKIKGQKTSKSWIFWVENSQKQEIRRK
jgi:hypothetical protein